MDVYILKQRCPECYGEHVVVLYEQYKTPNGSVYSGICGSICMDCCWYDVADQPVPFGNYTQRYCIYHTLDVEDPEQWDPEALWVVRELVAYSGLKNSDKTFLKLEKKLIAREKRMDRVEYLQQLQARRTSIYTSAPVEVPQVLPEILEEEPPIAAQGADDDLELLLLC